MMYSEIPSNTTNLLFGIPSTVAADLLNSEKISGEALGCLRNAVMSALKQPNSAFLEYLVTKKIVKVSKDQLQKELKEKNFRKKYLEKKKDFIKAYIDFEVKSSNISSEDSHKYVYDALNSLKAENGKALEKLHFFEFKEKITENSTSEIYNPVTETEKPIENIQNNSNINSTETHEIIIEEKIEDNKKPTENFKNNPSSFFNNTPKQSDDQQPFIWKEHVFMGGGQKDKNEFAHFVFNTPEEAQKAATWLFEQQWIAKRPPNINKAAVYYVRVYKDEYEKVAEKYKLQPWKELKVKSCLFVGKASNTIAPEQVFLGYNTANFNIDTPNAKVYFEDKQKAENFVNDLINAILNFFMVSATIQTEAADCRFVG